MRKNIFASVLLLTLCTATAQKVTIAAAANLRYVLEEIKVNYLKKYPKAKVNLTFGASGTLVQQISNGAAFDFFMAADNEFPLKLKDKGLTYGPISTYAFGKLAMYSTTVAVNKKGLEALKDPKVLKIAIANPETAPYGERAIELLKKLKVYDNLKSKLVIAENISAAAQYAFSGNTEIGFVALSLALAPEMNGKGTYFIVPASYYKPIEQTCVLIKTQVLSTEVARFRKYVLSAETRPLWEKWGYRLTDRK